jgi:2-polyprenyl-3-methyl-5-hydroxy-6-metoxy-1,4-benzoquinol methylase
VAVAKRKSHRVLALMKQTPIHDNFNAELLALIPRDAKRVIEVGCSSGALAREYRKLNRACEYVGMEIDPEYAKIARAHCSHVLVGNIEHIASAEFEALLPVDCWIFGDVLEHLYDPWAVLRRICAASSVGTSVVACIPNAQHWSVQLRLNAGEFRYEDMGLFDRTHIRWFTKQTILELFSSTGFSIVEGGGRVLHEPYRERGLEGVRALAAAMGADPETAASDATPFQWVLRATVLSPSAATQ